MAPTNSRGMSIARRYESDITAMIRARRIPRDIEKQKVRALSKKLAKDTVDEVCSRFLPAEEKEMTPFLDDLRGMINEEYSRTEVDEDQKKAIRLRPTQYLALMLEVNRHDPKRKGLDLKKQKAEIKRWKRENGCSQARRKAGFRLSSYWWRTKRRMREDGSEDMSDDPSGMTGSEDELSLSGPAPVPVATPTALKQSVAMPLKVSTARRSKKSDAVTPLASIPKDDGFVAPLAPSAYAMRPMAAVSSSAAAPDYMGVALPQTPFSLLQFFNTMDALSGNVDMKVEDLNEIAHTPQVPDTLGQFDWMTPNFNELWAAAANNEAKKAYPTTASNTYANNAAVLQQQNAWSLGVVPEAALSLSLSRDGVHSMGDSVVPGM
eukprot:Opistho-2@49753